MKIADIFIGKPGGMTISEAIACADYPCAWFPPSLAKKKEIAIISWKKVLLDLTTLPFKLERLLEDPDRLVRMKANALRFAKPLSQQPS